MKGVIAYYSFSGKTRTLCERLAASSGYKLIEIKEKRSKNLLSALFSVPGARGGKASPIDDLSEAIKDADVVCLAGPIWGSSITPALNAALKTPALSGKKVLGILTCAAAYGGASDAFKARAMQSGAVSVGVNIMDKTRLADDGWIVRLDDWLRQAIR